MKIEISLGELFAILGKRDTKDAGGCEDCKYSDKREGEYPCSECKHSHTNMYEKGSEE